MSRKPELAKTKTSKKQSFNAISEITIPDDCKSMVIKGPGFDAEFKDGKLFVRSGEIVPPPVVLAVGDVVPDGPNKGWIYCETSKGEPFLVSPDIGRDPRNKNSWDGSNLSWGAALDLAVRGHMSLPNKEQLEEIFGLCAKKKGFLSGLFSAIGPNDVWTSEYKLEKAWGGGR